MMSGGKLEKGMCMYSNLFRGVLRYMLEMSMPIHLAFGVESTLLKWILMVSRPVASVLVSSG